MPTEEGNERRDRLLMRIHPRLKRLAGRHGQKTGLPWQWRQDHLHDMLIAAAGAYERYQHLPDDDLAAVLTRVGRNWHKDHLRRCLMHQSRLGRTAGLSDAADHLADHPRPAPLDFDDLWAFVVDLAGLTPSEVRAIELIAAGWTWREAAKAMQISLGTLVKRMRTGRAKIAEALIQREALFR